MEQKSKVLDLLSSRKGQVLVFTALMLLVLAMFFLVTFNTGRMVAQRIKMQNAIDSAAQTAALWQARGLNFEGHLNFIQESLFLAYFPALVDPPAAEKIRQASIKVSMLQEKIANMFPGIAMASAFMAAKKNGLDAAWPVNDKDFRKALSLGVKKTKKIAFMENAFTIYKLDSPKYWSPQERNGPFATIFGFKKKEEVFGLDIIGLKNRPFFVVASARPRFEKGQLKKDKVVAGWGACLMPVRVFNGERGQFMGKQVYH